MAAAACAERQTALCRSQVFPALIGRVGVLFVIYAVIAVNVAHVASRRELERAVSTTRTPMLHQRLPSHRNA